MTDLVVVGESPSTLQADPHRLGRLTTALRDRGLLPAGESLTPVSPRQAEQSEDAATSRVVVVHEQLAHLNALYCQAVLSGEVVSGFDVFAKRRVDSGRHDYGGRLLDLLDEPGAVAVPAGRLGPGDPLPGPVLVGAIRILHKRLRHVQREQQDGPDPLAAAIADLMSRATDHSWDSIEFWGWQPAEADRAAEHFAPGNAEFAERAWGTEWPDPAPSRDQTRIDLAGSDPAVASDVFESIQHAVDSAR